MTGNTRVIPFSIYINDFDLYRHLKEEGKIKHGELSKFLRAQFRLFLEAHSRQGTVHAKTINVEEELGTHV